MGGRAGGGRDPRNFKNFRKNAKIKCRSRKANHRQNPTGTPKAAHPEPELPQPETGNDATCKAIKPSPRVYGTTWPPTAEAAKILRQRTAGETPPLRFYPGQTRTGPLTPGNGNRTDRRTNRMTNEGEPTEPAEDGRPLPADSADGRAEPPPRRGELSDRIERTMFADSDE